MTDKDKCELDDISEAIRQRMFEDYRREFPQASAEQIWALVDALADEVEGLVREENS